MRCSRARRYIDLSRAGLDSVRKERLQEHLNLCAGCRAYLQQDERLGSLIGSGFTNDLPQWIHNRILAQAQQHDARRVHIKHRGRWQAVPTLAAIAVSLYLGGLVGFKAFNSHATSSENNSASAVESQEYASFGESTLLEFTYTEGDTNE